MHLYKDEPCVRYQSLQGRLNLNGSKRAQIVLKLIKELAKFQAIAFRELEISRMESDEFIRSELDISLIRLHRSLKLLKMANCSLPRSVASI